VVRSVATTAGLESPVLRVWAEKVLGAKQAALDSTERYRRFLTQTAEEIYEYELAEAKASYTVSVEWVVGLIEEGGLLKCVWLAVDVLAERAGGAAGGHAREQPAAAAEAGGDIAHGRLGRSVLT
jgi:hypothetical protein